MTKSIVLQASIGFILQFCKYAEFGNNLFEFLC